MCTGVRKIVAAVSGGVDSVVLLDLLAENKISQLSSHQPLPTNHQLIVAHFDHGMRKDSKADSEFVANLAKQYGLVCEVERVELGAGVSEATAREVRYSFLRRVCKEHAAQTIITAHHQDDVLETAIINLLRGTGWRGLTSLRTVTTVTSYSRPDRESSKRMDPRVEPKDDSVELVRPLLNKTKTDLVEYAKKNKLEWREDSTNNNQNYLRNYVRHVVIPRAYKVDPAFNKKMLKHIETAQELRSQIESELAQIEQKKDATNTLSRHQIIMWPEIVAHEVIHHLLTQLDPDWHPEKHHIERVLHFAKTAKPGKRLHISKQLSVQISSRGVTFQFTP